MVGKSIRRQDVYIDVDFFCVVLVVYFLDEFFHSLFRFPWDFVVHILWQGILQEVQIEVASYGFQRGRGGHADNIGLLYGIE